MSLRSHRTTLPFFAIAIGALALAFLLDDAAVARASEDLPVYLRDRGTGVSTSLVGTYVRGGELLVYPFYEYTVNKDQEYKPAELGYGVEHDYTAKRTDHEALLFLAYGITKDIGFEFESALWTTSTQHKAPADTSALPSRLIESGFGDTQAEIRWRWVTETQNRPELFTYFEAVFPFQKDRVLIGTQEWELVPGLGLIKGFAWGTLTGRISASYLPGDGTFELGEMDVEYLKRTSEKWRWALSVEGEQDEWAATPEIQWHFKPNAFAKLNDGIGLTAKAPDHAPEVGVVFSF
jgi:hypothetical protein